MLHLQAKFALFFFFISLSLGTAVWASENITEGNADNSIISNDKDSRIGIAGEYFDKRTGQLYWEIVDMTLPGAGGFDLPIIRSWNKTDDSSHRLMANWEFEIPRIKLTGGPGGATMGTSDERGYCGGPYMVRNVSGGGGNLIQVVYYSGLQLIIPGQAPKTLLYTSSPNYPASVTYATTDNWIVKCITPPGDTRKNGFLVIAPDGTVYTLDTISIEKGFEGFGAPGFNPNLPLHYQRVRSEITVYASEIKDRYGNTVSYNYTMHSSNKGKYGSPLSRPLVNSITTSDGRQIDFSYTQDETPYIDQILINGHIWNFTYSQDRAYLEEAIRPDMAKWIYDYSGPKYSAISPRLWSIDFLKGRHHLKSVTTPEGLLIDYGYGTISRNYFGNRPASYVEGNVPVIISRAATGNNIQPLNHNFAYSHVNGRNVTTITGAVHSKHEYSRDFTQLGSLLKTTIYNENATVARTIEYTWVNGSRVGEDFFDNGYYKDSRSVEYPKYLSKVTTDSQFTTTYKHHDAYGNPALVSEKGTFGEIEKVSVFTYHNLTDYDTTGNWIVGVVKDERLEKREEVLLNGFPILTIAVEGTISRTFDNKTNLIWISDYGIEKTFEYYPNGDLHREKFRQSDSGPEIITEYKNYKLGISQREEHPEAIVVTRIVDANGRVISETDGEGNTTTYAFDGIGRLISEALPGQSIKTTVWNNPNKSTLSQGDYREVTHFDAQGRAILIEKYDIKDTSRKIHMSTRYDRLGRKEFESQPSFTATETKGIAFSYDVLNRIKTQTNTANNGVTQYFYNQDWNAEKNQDDPGVTFGYGVKDGRGYKKVIELGAYGNPDSALPIKISAQISNEQGNSHYTVTDIDRNLHENYLAISQGGKTRNFTYNSNRPMLLATEVHPETGTTTYTYDNAGNRTSRAVGSSPITQYEYDDLNRLTKIDYPAGTPDVVYGYYRTGDTKYIDNTASRWDYLYNSVGQPTEEKLTVDGHEFKLIHGYNLLGHISSTTYPNGEQVDFSPNIFNQPTKLGNYASEITYHANGLPKAYRYRNGHLINIDIDALGFPEEIRSGIGTTNHLKRSYSYDTEGNVQSITDGLNAQNSITLAYDGANRLTSASSPQWGGSGTVQYDDRGNITNKNIGGANQAYSYNASSDLLKTVSGGYSFSYDDYGNITGNGKNTFSYDDAGNLTAVNGIPSISYTYDGNNRRVAVSKVGGSGDASYYAMYDLRGNLVHRLDALSGNRTNYIYLNSRIVAENLDCSANDADLDGIPDCVESAWGLNPNDAADINTDTDNDGLSDLYEYAYDLNPRVADTDGDGLTDLYEVTNNVGGFLNGDTDGDGLSDHEEYLAGTNPLLTDTDGDGIPDGQDSNPTFNTALLIPILHLILN